MWNSMILTKDERELCIKQEPERVKQDRGYTEKHWGFIKDLADKRLLK